MHFVYKLFSALSACLIVSCTAVYVQAATLEVVAGKLKGASGVLVSGQSYDVEFFDASCSAAFDGCDALSDFAFTTQGAATLAAQALIDQVFLDGPDGNFDSRPETVVGCDSISACAAVIPFTLIGTNQYRGVAASNSRTEPDVIGLSIFLNRNQNFAQLVKFTPAVVPVPLPIVMAASTLALLGAAGWRRSTRRIPKKMAGLTRPI